ncbi:MAG TPA: OPT family oligopeptide transporter [Vicinamibacterales bacterium]|nr:OPT family oligopeptide transporter [Vicinamibacterales bacterium]
MSADPVRAHSGVAVEAGTKPAGLRELTPRAIVCGLAVAAIMGASYPYIVLKLGFGPNVSVVAAFFGYLALGLAFKDYNRWENNIVQTAGTAGAQTAFMCVLLAAFDMLNASRTVTTRIELSPLQSFVWLSTAGLLGVLLAVPMRQHFVVDEALPYPDGLAAGQTLIVLDGKGAEARQTARALVIGLLLSAAVMLMTEDAYVLRWFPSVTLIGTATMMAAGVGVNWSLLSIGSGMLVGFRINASMLLGTVVAWVVGPYALLHYRVLVSGFNRNDVLFWMMWPATGMMVAGGLTALVLHWNVLMKTFRQLRTAQVGGDEFPLAWVGIGGAILSVALIVIQKISLGLEVWVTATAILLSIPLMLVGLRVLGETNWGPISPLSNMMQGVFGALAPGQIVANMLASGTTGTIAVESEALMQDYRAGQMIGSSPRALTYMQLLATPVGAAAVSWMYPLLRDTYGIVGPQAGLTSPISRKWAAFAEVLSQGLKALPPGAIVALVIGSILGIVFTVMESKGIEWVPSPTAAGIGMLVPASVIIVMFAGSVVDRVWAAVSPASRDRYMTPLASGLIAGEAVVAVIVPLLVIAGVLHP